MRKPYFFSLFILLCSAFSFGFTFNDDDPLKSLISKLEQFRQKHPQEKVHIHTDKPYYVVGDTLWFKSYVVTAEKNQLSLVSNILYVDLINERDSIKKSLRLPMVSGLTWGDFVLSDSLSEGNYRIRAYTNWMRNYDDDYFFDKQIKIGNSLTSQVVTEVKYNYSSAGVKQNVDALISYSTLDGKPLKGKQVDYDVQLDNRNVSKGKGVTDSSGNLRVKFTNAQPFVMKSGVINTLVKLDSKTQVRKALPVKSTSNESDVQFLPEGGNLINNIRSRVGFKAIGSDGLSRKVSGYVEDNNAQKVAQFTSLYAGIGVFGLMPVKGQKYTAVVKFEDGSEKRVDLPAANDSGTTLSVIDQEENLAVRVSSVFQNESTTGEIILVAQSNGVVHYVTKNPLSNGTSSATLSKARFPAGIVQFTLFNSSYQPLAERLVFIRPRGNEKLVDVTADKSTYKTREKVRLSVNSLDSAGKITQGAFSLAITNESDLPYDDANETTILSNLLLSSDLKGFIETPNYYFTGVSAEKNRALDNLMLTHGWRRFDWKNLAAGNFPQIIYNPEKSLSISGRVTTLGGAAVAGGKVMLMSSGGTGMLLDTVTNAEGRFSFDNLNFNDSTKFVVQARTAKDKKNVEIEVDLVPKALVTKSKNAAGAEVNVNQSMLAYIKNRSEDFDVMRKHGMLRKNIVLSEVKISESRPKLKNSSNLNGAGNADAVILAKDLENCSDLTMCLQGRVAGLIVQGGVAYFTRSMHSSLSGPVPAQLIVDGMYMDSTDLSMINPQDIESVEVLKSGANTAIYGMRGGGGVLIINTKRGGGNLTARSFAPGIMAYYPKGLYYAREFYSPNYSVVTAKNLPDLRTTIFWAPNVITNKEGKASLEFFTSDKPGVYKAVIEGIDLNGSISRQVHRFTVK